MAWRNPTSARQVPFYERSWVAMLALVAVFLAANLQLLTGEATEHWDGEAFFAPFFSYLANVVRSGHWLLWNPFSNAGSPDFVEPQIGAFSPITLGFAALAGPSAVAFRLYWLCLWLFGGIGMFVYARSLGAPVWGRFLAGLSFVFSGFYLGHGQHLSVIHSISFLPWIILRLDRALLTGRRAPALEAGALLGLSALAGNPAITISTGLFAGAYSAVRFFSSRATAVAGQIRPALETLALFGFSTVVVLSPTYFSFKYETVGYSDRSGPLTRECVVSSNVMKPTGLAAILNPYGPGISRANAKDGQSPDVMSPTYFGAAPLALALLALALPGRRRWKWGMFFVGLLFLGCTLGTALPLRGWLYDLVPATRYFRHPNMFRVFFIFSIIVLAILASGKIDHWRRLGDAPAGVLRRFAIISAVLAAVGIGVFSAFCFHYPRLGPYIETAVPHAIVVWLGLAAIAAAVSWRPAWLARLPGALVVLTVGDLLCAHYLSADLAFNIGVGEPARPTTTRSPVDLGPENFARAFVVGGNEHLFANKPVYCSYAALLNSLHLNSAEAGTLMGFATGEKRVWFSTDAVEAPVSAETLALLTTEGVARKAPVLLRHRRGTLLGEYPPPPFNAEAIHNAPSAERVPFEVLAYRPNELSLKVECPSDGWVLVTDRWSRSWRATVNGIETPIAGGNLFFRLLPVQAGENLIEMNFEPFLLWPLLTTSWTLLGVIGLGAALRAGQRSANRPPPAAPKISTPPVPCGACS